jgi:hypothetical protein
MGTTMNVSRCRAVLRPNSETLTTQQIKPGICAQRLLFFKPRIKHNINWRPVCCSVIPRRDKLQRSSSSISRRQPRRYMSPGFHGDKII